ncbi:MAG: type I-E CRISPR-associated protein Cas7/Cse4/CasC [Verrucomicrobia bacterium]|nr:type I-E CRISPR-associated protein Cas7/Cse4/CasC [Verrucomicrobiota bacterium]
MKLIELHILQSFPVSCLNRDDVGAPKTAVFGGVNRARISSQCLKRAIREYAKEELPAARFGGTRSRLIIEPLKQALLAEKLSDDQAARLALAIADELSGLDDKTVGKDGQPKEGRVPRVSTLIFLSPAEIKALAKEVAAFAKKDSKAKLDPKKLIKACQSVPLSDAADIAIFGRMVAKGPDLTLEGAAMFSHALSTHKADNDIDFFSAVDDDKPKEEDAGAGMIGTIEFTSAVYYRYAALNLGLLADQAHLGKLSPEERRVVVDAFIRATLQAVPSARKNSMNGHTFPTFVLGLYKDKGQPVQLVNAFEKPVWSKDGLLDKSIQALKAHHEALKKTWNIATTTEVAIPSEDMDLNTFCQRLAAHVP